MFAYSIAQSVLFMASLAFAPGTLEDWSKFVEAHPRSAELYLFGIGEGYGWANVSLESRGDKALYCVPTKLQLLSTNYSQIAAEEISLRRAKHQLPASYTVELALLHGLQRTFPCPSGGG